MISPEQREQRRKFIGSSDVAAILGLDPFKSKADVWLAKTGRADDAPENEHTLRGTRLEPVILDWAADELDKVFARDRMAVHANGVLAANFDGIGLPSEGYVVEAKSSVNPDEWGEPGTDVIPDRVVVQAHHQMYVAGPTYRVAHVPVLLPGYRSFDFRMYRVERNDVLAEAVAHEAVTFMTKHVKADLRPDDFRPSVEVLKRVRRQPEKVVIVPDELVLAYVEAKRAEKQAEKACEAAQASLLAAMDDAEGARYAGGLVTYLQVHRTGYVVEPCVYRQLRLPKGAK